MKTSNPALAQQLRRAVMRVSRRLRVEATSEIVTPGQLTVLSHLTRSDYLIGELAELEHVQAPSMTRMVNNLEAAQLLERVPSEKDKRQVLVRITEAGRAVIHDTRSRRTEWLQRRLGSLTSQQRAVLKEAAEILIELSDPLPPPSSAVGAKTSAATKASTSSKLSEGAWN